MFGFKSLLTIALVSAVAALPTLEVRAATTYGSASYTAAQVSAVAPAACQYVKDGSTAGNTTTTRASTLLLPALGKSSQFCRAVPTLEVSVYHIWWDYADVIKGPLVPTVLS